MNLTFKHNLSDYHFDLPEKLIAQRPLQQRSESQLLICNPCNSSLQDTQFNQIINHLSSQDVLVINEVKVMACRFFALFNRSQNSNKPLQLKAPLEVCLEVFFERLEPSHPQHFWAKVKPLKKIKKPFQTQIPVVLSVLAAKSQSQPTTGINLELKAIEGGLALFACNCSLEKLVNLAGLTPLPPYIKRPADNEDAERYQTIYAKSGKALAAPTAGFHFDEGLLEQIQNQGIEIIKVCLEVNSATFNPILSQDIRHHPMHTESFSIDEENAHKLFKAKKNGKRIVAVGTTSLRVLESLPSSFLNNPQVLKGETSLFITPHYRPQVANALITNFHQPKTTLVVLVASLMGYDFWKQSYTHALKNKYRFLSYGDSMFIPRFV